MHTRFQILAFYSITEGNTPSTIDTSAADKGVREVCSYSTFITIISMFEDVSSTWSGVLVLHTLSEEQLICEI